MSPSALLVLPVGKVTQCTHIALLPFCLYKPKTWDQSLFPHTCVTRARIFLNDGVKVKCIQLTKCKSNIIPFPGSQVCPDSVTAKSHAILCTRSK